MKRLIVLGLMLLIGLAIGIGLSGRVSKLFGPGPDPTSIAAASLQSMREQNRLTPFTARYVAVVTSEQRRLGMTARKTLIMPGTVRYEVDLARLTQRDVAWEPATNILRVTLPPIELAGPEVDVGAMQEYDGGGMLLRLTDSEVALDRANRARGQSVLIEQARAPAAMRLARDAAKRAVERSFVLPLQAAGVRAQVVASFADEAGSPDPSRMDRSRRPEDVLRGRPITSPATTPSS